MGKKWQWYCDATKSLHGHMICSSCHKPITDGEYRCRETKNEYVTQHRACSESDPMWALLDGEQVKTLVKEKELHRDVSAFVRKWGIVDLEDVLDRNQKGGDKQDETK